MPQTLEDGTIVYTEDEMNESIDEKTADLASKIEELETASDEEKESLQKDKEKLEADLAVLKDKDTNFKKLRNRSKENEEENAGLKKTVEDTTKRIDDIVTANKKETQDEMLQKAGLIDEAGKVIDKDLKETFDHYYEQVGKTAVTTAQIKKATQDALILAAQGKEDQSFLDKVIPTRVGPGYKKDENAETPVSKEFAKQFGITPEDKKKYGGDSIPLI